MAAQFLYETKGYRSGAWSAAATELKTSNGTTWNDLGTNKGSAFYRTTGGVWRRFFSGINIGGQGSVSQYSSPNSRGVNTFNFKSNGELSLFDTEGWNNQEIIWDEARAPDNADLEINFSVITAVGGTWIGAATGTWLALTTNKDVSFRTGINTSGNGSMSVSIRHTPTLITLDTITLSADVTYV
jgi:hypothetical protein